MQHNNFEDLKCILLFLLIYLFNVGKMFWILSQDNIYLFNISKMCWTLLQEKRPTNTNWLTIFEWLVYVILKGLRMTFINVSEAYFLQSSNMASNMVTLKPELLSPRSRVSIRHVAHVLENYSQIRIRSSVLLLDKYFIFYHSVFAPKICQC